MHRFTVWAPDAGSVDLCLREGNRRMVRDDRGWWSLEVEEAGPGTAYSFLLDGQDQCLPDPRSPWQPEGVHGPSCVVDHDSFPWTDRNWQAPPLPSAVIYELHVGTFTDEGTFDAVIGKLDYLHSLGLTHIELMPVNEFPGGWGWGYDGVDLFAPHHAYGGPDGLKRLVNAAHERGIAVILDVVYNHLGPSGNYLSRFGPYFTSRHRTPWGEAVNLDGPDCGEVRRFFYENALMWLRDYHFDGLRLDAVHALMDSGAIHFVEQLAVEVEKLAIRIGRHLVVIAESDLNDPRVIRPREMGGYGVQAQWSDDFHHALHAVITGERSGYYSDFGEISHLAKSLEKVFVYDGEFSRHRKRPHGRPVRLLSAHHFLGYIQNHDQIGNRARGDRLSHLSSPGLARVAAGVVLTAPFIPMLFQGEEWGASSPFQYFTNHDDPELGRAVSEGRRREFVDFGWMPEQVPDPQDPETFRRSKLRWDELDSEPHALMLDWHRRLLRFRRQWPELMDGNLEQVSVRFDEDQRWLTFQRGRLTICCNFASDSRRIPLPHAGQVLIASGEDIRIEDSGVSLGPETFAVVGSRIAT